MTNTLQSKAIAVLVGFIIVLLSTILVFYRDNSSNLSSAPKNITPTTIVEPSIQQMPQRTQINGDILCLPSKDTSEPQTKECRYGIKVASGENYALDVNLLSSTPPTYKVGDSITANGIITPIEALSTDMWQKYDVKGIFSVTDSFTILQ